MKKMDISWILDQCAIMIVDEGMSLVDCLERYPDEWDEILPLLYTARRLQAVSNITASADLRQGGLATLRAHAAAHPHPKATVMTDISRRGEKTHQGRFSWNVALVSFLLVVILLVGGANVAAAAALPGNWLYPLKLAQETARVWIVPDESERLRLRLAWADRRLEEAQTRLDQGRSHDTQQALQGYVHLMETSLKEISGEPGGATQSQVNQWMLQELERQRLQLIQIQEVAGPLASMHEVLYASQQIQERVEYQVRQQLHETPQQPASTTTNPGMVGTVEATSQTTKKAPTPMPDGQQIFRSPATGEPAKVSPGGLNYPVWTKTSPGQADATPVPYRTRQPVEVNPTRQLPTPDRGGANPPGDEHESQPSNPTGNRPDPSGDRPGSPEDRSGSQGDRASPGGRSPGQRR